MIICLEGADATGKSTLAATLHRNLGFDIIPSEGPPRYLGEINERMSRYAKLSDVIFDRHPAVSQPIYARLRPHNPEPISGTLIEQFYNSCPLFIYCDATSFIMRNHTRNTVDTDEHLEQITEGYKAIVLNYRAWAIKHAFIWYRIGDDVTRVVRAVKGVYSINEY